MLRSSTLLSNWTWRLLKQLKSSCLKTLASPTDIFTLTRLESKVFFLFIMLPGIWKETNLFHFHLWSARLSCESGWILAELCLNSRNFISLIIPWSHLVYFFLTVLSTIEPREDPYETMICWCSLFVFCLLSSTFQFAVSHPFHVIHILRKSSSANAMRDNTRMHRNKIQTRSKKKYQDLYSGPSSINNFLWLNFFFSKIESMK